MAVTKFPIIRLALWISLTLSLGVWFVRTVRAGLELPPFYADVHERLIENPLIGSTDFYYIVRYLRCLSQLDDLEREWMSMAESDDQRAAYKIQ